MKFGLKDNEIKEIQHIFANCNRIILAKVFGSRAMGNYKSGSDVDIALFGDELTTDDISHIKYVLNEENLMPYIFDILHYNTLLNVRLKNHIDEVGIIIYGNDFYKIK